MLGLALERRAVASVLTPTQVAQLPRLQTDDLMKALRRPSRVGVLPTDGFNACVTIHRTT